MTAIMITNTNDEKMASELTCPVELVNSIPTNGKPIANNEK